jgi:hypothetical protein
MQPAQDMPKEGKGESDQLQGSMGLQNQQRELHVGLTRKTCDNQVVRVTRSIGHCASSKRLHHVGYMSLTVLGRLLENVWLQIVFRTWNDNPADCVCGVRQLLLLPRFSV